MTALKTALACTVAIVALVGWVAVLVIDTAWQTLVLGRGADEQIDAND